MSQTKNIANDLAQFIVKTQIAKMKTFDEVKTIHPETILDFSELLDY